MEKIKIKHILITLVIIYLALVMLTPNKLVGDEVFYYNQAQHIKQFELVDFDRTQPYGYSLFLALSIFENLYYLRFLTALLLILTLYFLYLLIKQKRDEKTAKITTIIVGTTFMFVNYSILLFTESIYLLSTLASIYYLEKSIKTKQNKHYLLLTLSLILVLQIKIAGLVNLFVLVTYLLVEKRKEINTKIISSFSLSIISLIPYIIQTNALFLQEKIFSHNFFLNILEYYYLIDQIGLVAFILIITSLLFYKPKENEKIFIYFAALYALILVLSQTYWIDRHILPTYFFVVIIASIGLCQKPITKLKKIIIILLILTNIFYMSYIPKTDGSSFYTEIPKGCINPQVYIGSEPINQPYFSQEARTFQNYKTNFYFNQTNMTIFISYVSDQVTSFVLNDKDLTQNISVLSFEDNIINVEVNQSYHNLSFLIMNPSNIGGFGQLLICEESVFS
ncbi:MAG: glycosyltransferase family 39 protein [Candidatus Woesearchaeota archaeon]